MTDKEKEEMYATLACDLLEHHIPSISPQIGELLVHIVRALETVPNPSTEMILYKLSLDVVIKTALLHQTALIALLEKLSQRIQ